MLLWLMNLGFAGSTPASTIDDTPLHVKAHRKELRHVVMRQDLTIRARRKPLDENR